MQRLAIISTFVGAIFCAAALSFAEPATVDVVVAPFSSLGETNISDSLGVAVQKSLIADLARAHFHPSPAADSAAKYLINGSYQTSGQTVRFTAELVDSKTGSIVGGLNATGNLADLFTLEDTLSSQTLRQLRQLTHPTITTAAPATQPSVEISETAERYIVPAQPYYLSGERAPSNEYADQLYAARYRQLYGADYFNGYCGYYGCGYGGYSRGYGFGYGSYGHGINANFYGASTR